MDELSRTFLKPTQSQRTLPGQQASLILGGTIVHNNIHHHINLHFFGHDLENRFRQKTYLSIEDQRIIQWRAFERAFRKAPTQDCPGIFNLIHEKWPTNMIQASWDGEKNPQCQLCADHEETFRHAFACTSTQTSSTFKKGLATFRGTLRKIKTAPIIISAFKNIFQSFRKGYDVKFKNRPLQSKEMNDLVIETIHHQKHIGELFFVKGYVSSHREIAQNLFLGKSDFNDQLTDWSTTVIRAIWKFSCSMWENRCDCVHGRYSNKTKSARRQELITLIKNELDRTKNHAEHTTKQLRHNEQKSLGNAQVAALEIWLDMLRNVKGELFHRKTFEGTGKKRAQPITIFLGG